MKLTVIENQMRYFVLLKEVVKRDIKKKYYKSALGIIWTVLDPLLHMLVLAFVFNTIFQRSIDNFPIYVLCGRLTFGFITGSGSRGLSAITSNAGVIRSMYVPKYIFVLSRVTEAFVDLMFSLIALFLVMLVTGAPITPYLLMLPVLFILEFMFALGLALILATYGTFLRDLAYLYNIFTLLLHWLCALFYPITIIPTTYRFVFDLNPIYQYITIMRSICHEGVAPTEKSLIIGTCYAVLMLAMGISVFKSKENKFFLYV